MTKLTLHELQAMKNRREPISMLTAYDYPAALLADRAGLDMLLVGDSVGMVVHGMENTLGVTMEMMLMHTRAVKRGTQRAFIVADLPFMSYQTGTVDALRNAGRLLADGGADAVKLEGGTHITGTVRALVDSGIAVMGHIGLTPQSVSALGGFRVQGKTLEAARRLLAEARALQEAGVFALVLEAIPARLAGLISRTLDIPTIGIGAGAECDGQVLVLHDVLGLYEQLTPRFVRQYASLAPEYQAAMAQYAAEVKARAFPAPEHTYPLPDDVWADIAAALEPLEEADD